MEIAERRITFLDVGRYWFRIGLISWGGMYAILPRIKSELAENNWVPEVEFDTVMAAATLVPGPSFVSLAGLVGYRMKGWLGALIAMVGLMAPSSVMVAVVLEFLSSDLKNGPVAGVIRVMTVAMAGVVLANAWKIARAAPFRATGLLLLVATGAAILAGLPVVWTVIIAVIAGRLLLGGERA